MQPTLFCQITQKTGYWSVKIPLVLQEVPWNLLAKNLNMELIQVIIRFVIPLKNWEKLAVQIPLMVFLIIQWSNQRKKN